VRSIELYRDTLKIQTQDMSRLMTGITFPLPFDWEIKARCLQGKISSSIYIKSSSKSGVCSKAKTTSGLRQGPKHKKGKGRQPFP
jgi:hypothetical protein